MMMAWSKKLEAKETERRGMGFRVGCPDRHNERNGTFVVVKANVLECRSIEILRSPPNLSLKRNSCTLVQIHLNQQSTGFMGPEVQKTSLRSSKASRHYPQARKMTTASIIELAAMREEARGKR